MCSQTGRGRLEKRIFGNRILPKDRPDQILAGLGLALGIGLRQEAAVSRIQMLSCSGLSIHATLRKYHQSPAHREVIFSGEALDFGRQPGGNGDSLEDGRSSTGTGRGPWLQVRMR